jgi:uncharacterized protein (TIGR02444 family)
MTALPSAFNAPLEMEGALWRFALDVYKEPGFESACLELQEKAGVNVVALLSVLFAVRARKCGMTAEALKAMDAEIRAWHWECVVPLRRLRQDLKEIAALTGRTEIEPLRRTIKEAELKAEQIEFTALSRQLERFPAATHAMDLSPAVWNVIRFYCNRWDDDDDPSLKAAATAIVKGAAAISCPAPGI